MIKQIQAKTHCLFVLVPEDARDVYTHDDSMFNHLAWRTGINESEYTIIPYGNYAVLGDVKHLTKEDKNIICEDYFKGLYKSNMYRDYKTVAMYSFKNVEDSFESIIQSLSLKEGRWILLAKI